MDNNWLTLDAMQGHESQRDWPARRPRVPPPGAPARLAAVAQPDRRDTRARVRRPQKIEDAVTRSVHAALTVGLVNTLLFFPQGPVR